MKVDNVRVFVCGVYCGSLGALSIDGVTVGVRADGLVGRMLEDAVRRNVEARKDADAIVVDAEVVVS